MLLFELETPFRKKISMINHMMTAQQNSDHKVSTMISLSKVPISLDYMPHPHTVLIAAQVQDGNLFYYYNDTLYILLMIRFAAKIILTHALSTQIS